MTVPFNQFLVVVGYQRSLKKYRNSKKHPMGDPDRLRIFGYVSADMGMDPPNPELTPDEMQSVAFAAKMALAKVMVKRLKKGRKKP